MSVRSRGALGFAEALPRLVHLHEKGLLVPFLGAGMSVGTCRDWEGLIDALEQAERRSDESETPRLSDAAGLIQRANRIARRLRYRGTKHFEEALRKQLGTAREPPAQTRELAQIWWPLVLTTNYDNCFYTSFTAKFSTGMRVRGRSPADCQRVLTSLTAPSVPILWALQGYLATPCEPAPGDDETLWRRLGAEVVFGHEEYRRVTHKEPHFRRAFAEVYRSRSLLFLGSGLRDPYLLELLGEVLENLGPPPHPHYAFVIEGGADVDFLRTRLNTIVISYARHDELPGMLRELQEAIAAPRVHQMRWTYSTRCGAKLDSDAPGKEDLEIVRGGLPAPGAGECIALGVDRGPGGEVLSDTVSRADRHLLPGHGTESLTPLPSGSYVTRLGSSPVFLVAAAGRRLRSSRRNLRVVYSAMLELLDQAKEFSRLRVQLLAAGKGALFSPRFALFEMIRAFAAWRRMTDAPLKMSIHVVDPGVLFSISTGRVDVPELLTCKDLRFWVQVIAGDNIPERQLYFASPDKRLGELGSEFDLSPSWWVEVSPAPSNDYSSAQLEAVEDYTLEELGIVPGATLRFISSRDAPRDVP